MLCDQNYDASLRLHSWRWRHWPQHTQADIFSWKECAPWPRECGGDGEGEQMNNRNTALLATVTTVPTVTTDQLYIKWCSCSLSGHSCHPPQWEVGGGANVSHRQSSWFLQTSFVSVSFFRGGQQLHPAKIQSLPAKISSSQGGPCVMRSYSAKLFCKAVLPNCSANGQIGR